MAACKKRFVFGQIATPAFGLKQIKLTYARARYDDEIGLAYPKQERIHIFNSADYQPFVGGLYIIVAK